MRLDQHLEEERLEVTGQTGVLMRGRIAEDVAAVTDPAYVLVKSFSPRHRFGPCPWASVVDAAGNPVLPSKGDDAWIMLDEQEDAVIVSWWPYGL
jgi:hypothetical protein